jgi:alkylhydroperoxidase family enzyme
MDINAAVGSANGLSHEEVTALLAGQDSGFTPEERLLLRFADQLCATPADVDDGSFADLRKHFSEEQMVEFAAAIAQENYRARFNQAFDLESQKLYCPVPERK